MLKTSLFKLKNNNRINLILILEVTLLFLMFAYLSWNYSRNNEQYLSSIFTGLSIAVLQIILTVWVINKIIEIDREKQWDEINKLLENILEVEIKDSLANLVYMADFSDGKRSYCYLESKLEQNTKLEIDEVIYASHELVKSLKLDNFPDHYINKKGDDSISYQLHCLVGFIKRLEQNLGSLDHITQFYQIKMPSKLFSTIIQCRTAYNNLIHHTKGYEQFLSVSEKTGSLIDWNLKFEVKHKKGMYDSILKLIDIMINILNKNYNNIIKEA